MLCFHIEFFQQKRRFLLQCNGERLICVFTICSPNKGHGGLVLQVLRTCNFEPDYKVDYLWGYNIFMVCTRDPKGLIEVWK